LNREELYLDILAARPTPDEPVYIERRGEDYSWSHTKSGPDMLAIRSSSDTLPDAWIYYSGQWPGEDGDRWRAFFDDLIAEMESMAGGGDRCRWPLGEPWPHSH